MIAEGLQEPIDPETGTPGGVPLEWVPPVDFRGGEWVRRSGRLTFEGGDFIHSGRLRPGIAWIERLDVELRSDRDPFSGATTPSPAVDHVLEHRHKIRDPDELWLTRHLLHERDAGRLEAMAERDDDESDTTTR